MTFSLTSAKVLLVRGPPVAFFPPSVSTYVFFYHYQKIHSQAAWRHDESVEQRILLRGLSHIGATLSFDDWIAHWSLLALNEPAVTQV